VTLSGHGYLLAEQVIAIVLIDASARDSLDADQLMQVASGSEWTCPEHGE
jgi:hypothetical protein